MKLKTLRVELLTIPAEFPGWFWVSREAKNKLGSRTFTLHLLIEEQEAYDQFRALIQKDLVKVGDMVDATLYKGIREGRSYIGCRGIAVVLSQEA